MTKHTVTKYQLIDWLRLKGAGELQLFARSIVEGSNKSMETNFNGTRFVVTNFGKVVYDGDNAEKAIELYNELP